MYEKKSVAGMEYKRSKVTVRNSFSIAAVVAELNKRKELEDMPKVEKIKVIINGKELQVDGIFVDGRNYVAIRPVLEALGCNVSAQGNVPVIISLL